MGSSSHQKDVGIEVKDDEGFQQVKKKKAKRPILTGKKTTDGSSKVRAIPRRFTVFAGRLEQSTTEEDMKSLLKDSGVDVPYCKKLQGKMKDGREYKTAAFIISCDEKYKDIILDANTWPENCTVREWWVNQNPKDKK